MPASQQELPRDGSASAFAFAEKSGKPAQTAEELVAGERSVEDPPRTGGRAHEGLHHIAVAGRRRREGCEIFADLFAHFLQLQLEPLLAPSHLFEGNVCAHG